MTNDQVNEQLLKTATLRDYEELLRWMALHPSALAVAADKAASNTEPLLLNLIFRSQRYSHITQLSPELLELASKLRKTLMQSRHDKA